MWLILISPAFFTSCEEDFLDVTDPTVLATRVFPSSINDLDPIVAEIYGRLQNGYYSAYFRNSVLLDHTEDHGYNGAEFNECALQIVNPDMAYVSNMWGEMYLNIGKCNNFFKVEEQFKAKGTLTTAELTRLDQMEGQVRFIRAFNYFYLVNMFGESPIVTEADKAKMGIPIWDVQPTAIKETTKARATLGEVYDFIIADLKAAETLLKGVAFSQKPRVNEWAVKSLLGKVYVYTLQWDKAKTTLKEVIDNSGKKLVSYDILRNSFHGENEFNTESIFEVNYTPDPLNTSGSNVTMFNTGNRYEVYVSISYISATGAEANNGFGNLFVHDMNIPRYGFDDTTTVKQNRPDYIAKSKQVRVDKSVDPRLYVSMFQPFVDSIYYEGVWRKVTKNRCESYSNVNKKAWCNGKYNLTNTLFSKVPYNGINFIVIRLADVYLLYAEALIKSSAPDQALALEYINKVHRRGYNQPAEVPSAYDYSSLTGRTKTVDAADPLANDPLKYERWAELFAEGHWWFDVRRFGLGAAEAGYYKRVMGGALVWANTKYALPIPTGEINSNSLMVQNP